MTLFIYWLRRLYSLDTLDTRFTASADTPSRVAGDARPPSEKDARANAIAHGASPSKWRTPEFYFYYFVHLTVVPMMFKTAMDVSQGMYGNPSHRGLPSADSCLIYYRELSHLSNLLEFVIARLDSRP